MKSFTEINLTYTSSTGFKAQDCAEEAELLGFSASAMDLGLNELLQLNSLESISLLRQYVHTHLIIIIDYLDWQAQQKIKELLNSAQIPSYEFSTSIQAIRKPRDLMENGRNH